MTDALSDLIGRFELEVRTPRQRILIDAFLPAPETIPSAVPPPPPPAAAAPDEGIGFVQRLRAEEPAERPAPDPSPPPRPRRPKRQSAATKSLQEEIEEFMSSKGDALAPEPDPDP